MFIGHHAIAFAAKRVAPKTSLGTLFLAVQFADLLWPILLLLGFEHARIDPGNTVFTPLDLYDYPISHSLLTLLLWSALAGGTYYFTRRYRMGAWIVAICVFSHWILDFITHRPDMPILPGSGLFVGLSLWNSRAGTLIVEGALFVAGVWIYSVTTTPKDRIGKYGLWAFVALLVASYVSNVIGPPPPSLTALIVLGIIGGWLLVVLAFWIDRHRETRTINVQS